MKKKTARKLKLSRETIRSLEESSMGKVAGGSVFVSNCVGCQPSYPTELCATCTAVISCRVACPTAVDC